MDRIQRISWKGETLAYIIRAGEAPAETSFVTPPDANFQVGFIVYPADGEVARHAHVPLERQIRGTAEVLIVRQGRCLMDVYDPSQNLVETSELTAGDVMVMLGGGHGFRMLEDTVFLEVKQGPYTGLHEKERF